jgi:hypothetical protein
MEQELYRIWDGEKEKALDPMVICERLTSFKGESSPDHDMKLLTIDLGERPAQMSEEEWDEKVKALNDQRVAAYKRLGEAAYHAFDIKPPDENGKGVTRATAIVELFKFAKYAEEKKRFVDPLQIWLQLTERPSSETLRPNNASACGSTVVARQ